MEQNVFFVKKYDIYEVDLTDKQLGILPCVIVQNDVGNKYSPTTIVMPLVKEKTEQYRLYFKVTPENLEELYVCASLMQVISKERITKKDAPLSCIEDEDTKEKLEKYYLANTGMKKIIVNGECQIVDMTQEELELIYEESREC